MSTQTQLSVRGLARDPNSFTAAAAGALRRAENVVVRAEGVAESRPNFDLVRETIGSDRRIRALTEADDGSVIAIESDIDFGDWTASGPLGDIAAPISGGFEPPNYEVSQTQFAKARGNLYATGINGPIAIENIAAPARFCGAVYPPAITDYAAPSLANLTQPKYSYAYRFVVVRKDSHDYVRRSPPTARLVCAINADHGIGNGVFATGTRVYLGNRSAVLYAVGDQVECYRSRTTLGDEPRPEHYLTWTYTLTSTDIGNHWFPPPPDTTGDNQLGAELYTDAAQSGATSAKYTPPVASVLAQWQRCAWYGRVTEIDRNVVEMRDFFRAGAGIPKLLDINATYTSASATVQVTDTSQLETGQFWTDNLVYGPAETVLGVNAVPPNTTILSITDATHFVMSAPASANGAFPSGVVSPASPRGMIAESQGCSYVSGSAIVTGLTTTQGLFAGMYWTDNGTGGPTIAGTCVKAGTKIQSIASSTSIVMTKTAQATGSTGGFYGDIVTVAGFELYAWRTYSTLANLYTMPDPWVAAAANKYVACFAIGTPDALIGNGATGPLPRWLATYNVQQWLAYFETNPGGGVLTLTTSQLLGDASPGVLNPHAAGNLYFPPAFATEFVIEELWGNTGTDLTATCTAPTGIGPTNPTIPASLVHPNRLYFSDTDEPESVPLVNFIDIGTLDASIQALVPLRNALLVFKEDGLWRISGSAPSSWSVEQIDTTLRLIRAETVAVMNGTAYAWCDRGFFAVDESGAESLSANLLDTELRTFASLCVGNPLTHGAFVTTWRRRSLVLLGVPFAAGGGGGPQTATAKIYAYCVTTNAWTEWPLQWDAACSSELDTMYAARSASIEGVTFEIRKGIPPRGYDRSFDSILPTTVVGVTITVDIGAVGLWIPAEGDYLSAEVDGIEYVRRINEHTLVGSTWTFILESTITGATPDSVWRAYEAATMRIEWHPTAPARVPTGVLCRELHVQIDLTSMAGQDSRPSLPRYLVGGSSERDTEPQYVVSVKPRTPTIQPLRVGASRQIARSATIAPYFETSDIFPIRVQGISLVYEATSERTSR